MLKGFFGDLIVIFSFNFCIALVALFIFLVCKIIQRENNFHKMVNRINKKMDDEDNKK